MTGVIFFAADPWINIDEANADPAVAAHWRLTTDRSDYVAADVVVHPTPLWGTRPPTPRAHPGQVRVLWSQESVVNFPQLVDPAYTSQFDLQMTYRLDSDVPIPYLTADVFDTVQPLQPLASRSSVPVSAWVSSTCDRCGRDAYLLALMQHIAVDSYGRVGRNRVLPDDTGWHSKMAAIAGYRFTIAFENSRATDYVTEKFFQPLLAGSVPIYRGAPNVADFAPAPGCYIDADDFAGPAELAEFLRSLTDEQYLAFHQWRGAGPADEWRQRFRRFNTSAFARLAQPAAVMRIGLLAQARSERGGPERATDW